MLSLLDSAAQKIVDEGGTADAIVGFVIPVALEAFEFVVIVVLEAFDFVVVVVLVVIAAWAVVDAWLEMVVWVESFADLVVLVVEIAVPISLAVVV